MTLDPPPPEIAAANTLAGLRRRLALVRSGDLRLVWLAQVVSQLGDGMFTVGVVWLMIRLTGSGLALSGTLIAQLLPYAVLGAAAGALSDRWNRRLTMVWSDVVRGLVVVLIPLLDLAGALHAWMVPAVAFLLTSASQFFDPARNALVPAVTPEDRLVQVNAFLSGTRQVLFIAGPALGGAIVAAVGEMTVFWLDAVSFALSALVLSRMRTSGHAQGVPSSEFRAPRETGAVTTPQAEHTQPATRNAELRTGLLSDIREGLRYIWRMPLLRTILVFGTLDNFLLSPLPVLIPLFFVQELGLNAAGFGSALSVVFAGFLVGVAYVGVRGKRLRIGWLVIGAMAVAGGVVLLFGLGPPLPVILALGLVGGAAVGAMEVAETTLMQRETEDELRGRVFALYESVSQGGRALSVALAGGLSDLLGLRPMFYGVGILTVACAAILAANPVVRRTR